MLLSYVCNVRTAQQSVLPGVNVKITILSDFCQFWAKQLALVLKTNAVIHFCIE
jgi:hypothetical protein